VEQRWKVLSGNWLVSGTLSPDKQGKVEEREKAVERWNCDKHSEAK